MTAAPFGLHCHRCEEGIVADGACLNCGTNADDALFSGGQGRDAEEIEETGGAMLLVLRIGAAVLVGTAIAFAVKAAWAVIG